MTDQATMTRREFRRGEVLREFVRGVKPGATIWWRNGARFVMDAIEESGQAAIEHTWGADHQRVRSHIISAIGGTHGEHTQDDDCTMDDDGIFCIVCGVMHGWPCADCGGTGFHTQACQETEH